jgi:hypothetical protein
MNWKQKELASENYLEHSVRWLRKESLRALEESEFSS